MHKRDYFIQALRAECYRYKRWVIDMFSVTRPTEDGNDYFPYRLYRDQDGKPYFQNPENREEKIYIEAAPVAGPLFHFKEEVVLKAGDIANLHRNITSTYGNLLVNQIILVYPFGDKIDYMEGRIDAKAIEKIIEARLKDNPESNALLNPDDIYVYEYQRFNEALLSLAGYTQLCVPSATAKTMTTDPKIAVRRAELLEQYKDRLHDPVIQAKIDDELIAMDKAWLKGDPGEGFYIKDKSYNVVRKKTFLLQGAEQGFDVAGEVIPTSLNDGWDIKHLPAMGNSLREGSYNRGALTALGGEATKFNYRIFQNTVISEEDCKTPFGLTVTLRPEWEKSYISNSIITPKGVVELTPENIKDFLGKTVVLRSPLYCRTEGVNFCATCMGKKIASTPHAISTYAADIGSTFMSISLKAMHGKALKTAHFDIATDIG